MRLYCPCLNVSVAVQDSVTRHQPPQPSTAPAHALCDTLTHMCRWPAAPLACARLARGLAASLAAVRPELCRRSTADPHCALVECLNCRTVVLAAPAPAPVGTAPGSPVDVFVHPNLLCAAQDLDEVSSDTLELHLRSVLHAAPPEGMVFSPAFRMFVRAPAPDAAQHAACTEAFSVLQQRVQTYLEHEQQLMSSRIAAFIEEQEKLFEEERQRALRDRDALLLAIEEQERPGSSGSSTKTHSTKTAAPPAEVAPPRTIDSDDRSPLFGFQEDDRARAARALAVVPPRERAVPVAPVVPVLRAEEPREEREAVRGGVYSTSMPIQVPLADTRTLDLRKLAKRAFAQQACGRAASPGARLPASCGSAGLGSAPRFGLDEGDALPDTPLSQSFAVPSSLSFRTPFMQD